MALTVVQLSSQVYQCSAMALVCCTSELTGQALKSRGLLPAQVSTAEGRFLVSKPNTISTKVAHDALAKAFPEYQFPAGLDEPSRIIVDNSKVRALQHQSIGMWPVSSAASFDLMICTLWPAWTADCTLVPWLPAACSDNLGACWGCHSTHTVRSSGLSMLSMLSKCM